MPYKRIELEKQMFIISAVIEKELSRVALYNEKYKLILKKSGVNTNVSKLCLDVISESGLKTSDVDYIGVAVEDSMDALDSITTDIEKNTGIKCFGSSVISAKSLGEAYTSNDTPYLVMLKIDDTIETGIVIDKKIYSGAHQLGGDIAHIVINFGGYNCTCGRQGCFEAYAGNSGLKRIAAESGVADAEFLTHKKLFNMTTPDAERAKKLYVEYLASGITDIINLFQPHELVLDGPFTEVGDELMKPLLDIVLREQYTHDAPNKCNVRFSNMMVDTALIGAALLGR